MKVEGGAISGSFLNDLFMFERLLPGGGLFLPKSLRFERIYCITGQVYSSRRE